MKIPIWHFDMNDKDTADLACWERNVMALYFADHSRGDGWYNDDVEDASDVNMKTGECKAVPRFDGWRRTISLKNGSITFHVPDSFDVGNLPQIERNWDGHSTHEKWRRMLAECGIKESQE